MPVPDKEEKPRFYTGTETCLKCGTTYDVMSREPVPEHSTIDWCFNDGNLCEVGFELIKEQLRDGESEALNHKVFEHCKVCEGCRYASYTPEKWRSANRHGN